MLDEYVTIKYNNDTITVRLKLQDRDDIVHAFQLEQQ